MGLTATFEEGIAMFVATETAGLATIRSNKWLLSECISVMLYFGTLHAARYKQADCFTEWPLSEVPL